MKTLYEGFGTKSSSKIISSLYSKYQWEPVCISGVYLDQSNNNKDGIYSNCIICYPRLLRRAQFDYSEIGSPAPIDSKALIKLARYESTFMSILGSAQDPTGWNLSYMERKDYYFDILTYWNTVILKCKPELTVFYTWPHSPACYPLYLICKHIHNISVLFIDPNPLLNRGLHFICHDLDELSAQFSDPDSMSKDFDNYQVITDAEDVVNSYNKDTLEHIKTDFETYEKVSTFSPKRIIKFMTGDSDFKIISRKNLLNLHKLPKFLAGNLDWKSNHKSYLLTDSRMNLIQVLIFKEKLKIKNRVLKKHYASIVENPNLHKDYIYFAAPFQPEATSFVGAGYYENVILTIQSLSSACPQDWVIYYKEHPATFFDNFRGALKRNKEFYKRLRSFNNVKLIPIEFDQFNLIENSKAIAVISGSTAWESLIRSVPVISFGQGWYSNCNGILKVESMEDLLGAISKIYAGYRPTKEDVIRYTVNILNNSFEFPEHYYPTQVYDNKRVNLISDAFYKAYNKYYVNKL